ncbi:putative hydrolase [uncultured Mycobacterium sp.]|uniref:Putative hydrolase n=1 Tax=uncultured Mycobacterium sp. TaxID=171292 RepID=A0A1Y5PE18_9MYCO|nr:putative hydrolase [uncultured Mycobacterium sp.]
MDLFVRESGPTDAPAIVFLHGGWMSGWSWEPVVQRMQRYHCLVPDLPQYGGSFGQGPFDMSRATEAVADLIRSRVSTGPAHIVGFSLGAQVGLRLLATEPELVDRAVLCGAVVNTLPGAHLTKFLPALSVRSALFRRWVKHQMDSHQLGVLSPWADDYHEDVRLLTTEQLPHIVMASAGFTAPEGLNESDTPALFLAGGSEMWVVRSWAATLARPMPNGVAGVAAGMRHDWPVRNPELFSRTVDGWLSGAGLPAEIVLSTRE